MQIDDLKKEFSKNFVFSLLIIFLYYIFISFIFRFLQKEYKCAVPFEILISCFVGVCYIAFLVSKTRYNFLKMYKTVLVSIFLMIYFLGFIEIGKTKALFLFYIPLMLMVMVIFGIKKAFLTSIATMLICFTTFIIADNLGLTNEKIYPAEIPILYFFRASVTFFVAYLSLFMIYYNNKFNDIKLTQEFELGKASG